MEVKQIYEGEEEQYFTFASEESSKWMNTYHAMRENAGETLTQNSPLFREEFDIEKDDVVKNPQVIKEGTVHPFLMRLAMTAGVKKQLKLEKGMKNQRGPSPRVENGTRLSTVFQYSGHKRRRQLFFQGIAYGASSWLGKVIL